MSEDGHWEQFEQFRRKIAQECQSEEKHFKKTSYNSLEKVRKSSQHDESILHQPTETDRIIKLRIENQELRDQLKQNDELKDQHQAQLKQQKELYETENKDLKNKLIQFNDEVEELKKVYKEKNLKLYNLVLQLEKEKQELIEKNIQLLESQSNTKQQFNIHNLVEERTRILIEQIQQLEERNAKLQVEKNKIEEKYMNQLQNSQVSQIPQRTNRSSDRKPPPVPDHNRSIQTQSFEQLPPANKSILKNSKIQLSATKTKEKENLTPHNRSKILDTPKSQRKQPTSRTQSAQKKVKTKKQIYSKVK